MPRLLSVLLLSTLGACAGGDNAELHVNTWGEDAAFDGIPNDEVSFVDGWSVHYDQFLVSFQGIELADPSSEEVVASDDTNYVVDLSKAVDPADVAHVEAPAGRYKFSYSMMPATSGATNSNGADQAAMDAMVAGGFNVYFSGTATKGGQDVSFTWGFQNPRHYRFCENGADGTDGVALTAGEENEVQMSYHIDHQFWDRLGVEEAPLRFDPIAAWADENGVIDFDDLAGSPTAGVIDAAGDPVVDENGDPLAYDDAGLGLTNLKEFVLYSAGDGGHMNGVGECVTTSL